MSLFEAFTLAGVLALLAGYLVVAMRFAEGSEGDGHLFAEKVSVPNSALPPAIDVAALALGGSSSSALPADRRAQE